jgi:hypothetical protein
MKKKFYSIFALLAFVLVGCSTAASEYDTKRMFSQQELDKANIYSYDEICILDDLCSTHIDSVKNNIEKTQELGIDYRHGASLDERPVTIDHFAHANEELVLLYDINSETQIPLVAIYEDAKLIGFYVSEDFDASSLDTQKGSGYDLFIKENNVASIEEFLVVNKDLSKSVTDISKILASIIIEVGTVIETKNQDFEFADEIESLKDISQQVKDSYNFIKEFLY